jgi:DNA (cytosine-5)-methyltransferase 1
MITKIYNHVTSGFSEMEWEMVKSIPPGGNWRHIPLSVKSQRIAQIRETGGRTTYYGRLQWDKPSYTISTYFNRIGNGCFLHPEQHRLISIREAARLQSFKDSFIFYGSKTSQYKQIGNAVPPLLARTIAELIEPYLSNKTFMDLFSGAGGMSEGFLLQGYKLSSAIEIEKNFFETFSKNHLNNITNKEDFILGDVTLDENKDKLIKSGKKYCIDVIVGGPPCQGFSTAGLRDPNDKRNKLFMDFLDIVNEVKPAFFVIENVPGLLSMQKGEIVSNIFNAFRKIGYHVNQPLLLKAEEYGVPQLRRRVFIIGSLENIDIGKPKKLFSNDDNTLPKPTTVADAIKGMPPIKAAGGDFLIEQEIEPRSKYEEFLVGKISFEEFYAYELNNLTAPSDNSLTMSFNF